MTTAFQVLLVLDQSGHILEISPGVLKALGYEPASCIGKSAFEFIHASDHEHVALEMMREFNERGSNAPALLARLAHADGSWVDFEILSQNQFADPLVNGLLVSLRSLSGSTLTDLGNRGGDYLYQSLSTSASDGTSIFDQEGNRVYSSPSLCRMLGYTARELHDLGPGELMHPDDRHLWSHATKTAVNTPKGTARVECRIIKGDGTPLWIEASVMNLLVEEESKGVVVHIRNIDERHRAEEALIRRASIDDLTGLGNRSAFIERIETMSGKGQARTVLFADLDGFKAVNDEFGHLMGDSLLSSIGRALKQALPADAFIARMGGDEFCVLVDAQQTEQAIRLGEIIVSVVHDVAQALFVRPAVDPVAKPHIADRIGVSIGIATDIDQQFEPTSSLLMRSDHAMYESKREGRNRITVHGGAIQSEGLFSLR